MISPLLSTEARKFCETTSVRGVPRIMKSRSRVLFAIWLIGVLTFAGILIWQLVVVLRRYASYPVNTLFVQAPSWQNATFPDITVCNLCSLVHEKEMSLSYTNYSLKTFKGVTALANSSNVSSETALYIVALLVSPSAYFNNFPIASNFTINETNSPIIDFRFHNWDYSPNVDYNWSTNIQSIWDPDYYKCYTLKLDAYQRKNVRGFSGIFYVDNFLEPQWEPYSLDVPSSRATGMRVMIHPSGTLPNMKLGVNVGPGTDTTITLDQLAHYRLPAPYSNCTTQKTMGLPEQNVSYTQEYCLDVCLQQQYLNKCGCIYSTLQFSAKQLREANYTICGNLGLTNVNSSIDWGGFEELVCTLLFEEDESLCKKECFIPCEEYTYTSSISTAPWPHISSQLSVYHTYIMNKTRFGDKYDEYLLMAQEFFTNISASRRLMHKLDSEGLITKNFLQLNVRFIDSAYNEQKEVAAISIDALGAQIGGVLSLWLGVTVVLILEVCEFIYNLVSPHCEKKNKQKASDSPVAESKI